MTKSPFKSSIDNEYYIRIKNSQEKEADMGGSRQWNGYRCLIFFIMNIKLGPQAYSGTCQVSVMEIC